VQELLSVPNPVNEKAARVVAGAVLATVIAIPVTGWYWLLIALTYGFWARLLTGPKLSPLGWAAPNVVAPRLGAKRPVAGPPKRLAQSLGALTSTAALLLALLVSHAAADAALIALGAAAGLEPIFGYCLGCKLFAVLMRHGLVPESVCAECADISVRLGATAPSSSTTSR